MALFEDAYRDERFVEVASGPPHTGHVRGTNRARVYATVDEVGRVLAFAAIDNLWKGAAGQAVQSLNLMLGLPEEEGLHVSFFRSRWVAGARARARARAARPPRGLSQRRRGRGPQARGPDVGVLVSDSPATTSAARFTANARVGAPVMVSRAARLDGLRAVVANSGGSNVGDGQRGYDTAVAVQQAAAEELSLDPEQVGLASTGVIGVELYRDKVVAGARAAARRWARAPTTSRARS